ncbi:CDGSH iron-sulfur domain-containing protein 3 [Trichinella spiralis]|uniref:CDGSH iron-sulfur domain-containing protein 3 n=1 Tax=Trichinella spiralis TaxID=6334 RepID=A0ABR3KDJ7_TRISP
MFKYPSVYGGRNGLPHGPFPTDLAYPALQPNLVTRPALARTVSNSYSSSWRRRWTYSPVTVRLWVLRPWSECSVSGAPYRQKMPFTRTVATVIASASGNPPVATMSDWHTLSPPGDLYRPDVKGQHRESVEVMQL